MFNNREYVEGLTVGLSLETDVTDVEMNESVTETMITKQLQRMKQQTSQKVQAEQNKKGIAEVDDGRQSNVVIIAGGKSGADYLNSVAMFSLCNEKWTPLQPLKECRTTASSIVYNNGIFVIGGGDHRGIKSIEILSLSAVEADRSITWEKFLVDLPGRLTAHCSVVYNGRLITIGGYESDKRDYSDSITEVSLVPPYTKKLLATMPQKRWFLGVSLFGDQIMLLGGREHGNATNYKTVLLYDITKNEFKELAPLPYPVSEMATVKWGDDSVIVIGGVDSEYNPLNKVFMYNVKTQKCRTLPNMKYKRKGCVAAVVGDTVIVMGGQDERRNYLKSVEGFRFDRNTWKKLPDMHETRCWATAVAY